MYRMLDFADAAEPVSLSTTGAEVYSTFQNDPGTLVIAVVDANHRPVGLIERNNFFVKMGAEYAIEEIPADLTEKADKYRTALIETVAETDDALMEKFFEGEEITVAEIKAAIRKMTVNSEAYPVF